MSFFQGCVIGLVGWIKLYPTNQNGDGTTANDDDLDQRRDDGDGMNGDELHLYVLSLDERINTVGGIQQHCINEEQYLEQK
jgi:hypothetical protein